LSLKFKKSARIYRGVHKSLLALESGFQVCPIHYSDKLIIPDAETGYFQNIKILESFISLKLVSLKVFNKGLCLGKKWTILFETGRSFIKLCGHFYQFQRYYNILDMALLDIFRKIGSGWSASCLWTSNTKKVIVVSTCSVSGLIVTHKLSLTT